MEKTAVVALLLTLLMVSSSLIYFFSSIFNKPSLPEDNIIDYELSVEQKIIALNRGMTLLEFFYGKDCLNCEEKISFLESIASTYKQGIFLEKILANNSVPKLNIIGFNVTDNRPYLDERKLEGENITEENVFNILCEVSLQPIAECAKV